MSSKSSKARKNLTRTQTIILVNESNNRSLRLQQVRTSGGKTHYRIHPDETPFDVTNFFDNDTLVAYWLKSNFEKLHNETFAVSVDE